jgi:hypothetical protein
LPGPRHLHRRLIHPARSNEDGVFGFAHRPRHSYDHGVRRIDRHQRSGTFLCRGREPRSVLDAVSLWRSSARIFGPLLGLGILFGFGVAAVAHVPLTSSWLLISYGLIIIALGFQAAIMIPWQLRAAKVVAEGKHLSTQPIILTVSLFSVIYVSIVGLMLVKPA